MTPFKTPYEKSSTASRRTTARSQQRYSHISLWYEKQKEGEYKSIKDMAPKGQITRTSSKRLTAAERRIKNARTNAGRWENYVDDVMSLPDSVENNRTLRELGANAEEIANSISKNSLSPRGQKTVVTRDKVPDIERVNPFLPYLDPSDDGTQRSDPE